MKNGILVTFFVVKIKMYKLAFHIETKVNIIYINIISPS